MSERHAGTTTLSPKEAWELALRAKDATGQLACADLSPLADDDIDGLLVAVEEIARSTPAMQHSLTRELTSRGLDLARGYTSPASYLRDALRITRREANQRLRAVERFQPRVQPIGDTLPPQFPVIADALRAGEISVEHATVIASSLERLPEAVDAGTRDAAEAHLVDSARDWDPAGVHKRAVYLETVLDPDGLLTIEHEQKQQREVSLTRDLHGMYRLHGRLDAEAANTLKLALDPLAEPNPAPGEERDPRTAGQRRADALVAVASWSLGHDRMPTTGGHKPHVLITTTLAELQARTGTAVLDNGELVSIETLLRKACDADVSLAVFDTTGELLHYGRSRRLAPPALRRALLARDRGCVHPGCDAPPVYLEAHHLQHWAQGGETSIATMGLWCGRHHTLQHSGDWHAVMINGRPHVIPPPWIDSEQRPRRNHIHDPP